MSLVCVFFIQNCVYSTILQFVLVWDSLLIYPPDCVVVEWHGWLKDNIQMNLKEAEQESSVKYMIQYLLGSSEFSIENYMDRNQGISISSELLSASPSGWCCCKFYRMSLDAIFRKCNCVYRVKDVSVLLLKPQMSAHSLNKEMHGQ